MPTKVSRDDPPTQTKANVGSVPDEDPTTPVNTRIITFDNSTGVQSAYWSKTESFATKNPSVENKRKIKRFNYKPQDKNPLSSSKRRSLRKSPPLVHNSVGTPRKTNSAEGIHPPNNGEFNLQALLADHHPYNGPELDNTGPVVGSICDGARVLPQGCGSQHSSESKRSMYNLSYHQQKNTTTPNTNSRSMSHRSSVMSDLTSVPNHAPVNSGPVFDVHVPSQPPDDRICFCDNFVIPPACNDCTFVQACRQHKIVKCSSTTCKQMFHKCCVFYKYDIEIDGAQREH